MPTYRGEVRTSTDEDFPFLAIIVDEAGNVIEGFPVRTEADGEAKIVEALKDLKIQDAEGAG